MPRSKDSGQVARTRKKHDALITPVIGVRLGDAPVAEVASLDALVEVAKRYESMIMELSGEQGHDYLLWDDGFVFRFRDYVVASDAARTSVAAGERLHELAQLRRSD